MEKRISVIIPAAGASFRFKQTARSFISKLVLPLRGKTVLEHALAAFKFVPEVREIVIAANPKLMQVLKNGRLNSVCHSVPIRVVRGGDTRAESVWLALKKTSKKTSHVLIHDGARPLLKPEWVRKLIRQMPGADGVVLGRSVVPTVKRLGRNGDILETLDRRELFEAETPQIFSKKILTDAYRKAGLFAFQATDDASLVEGLGGVVKAIPHEGNNLKITTPEDLSVARKIVSERATQLRFGLGFDSHRLANGRLFYLGGVRLKAPFGSVGHSDGDSLLHAIIDGMLGALGLGDIGDFFPDTSARLKGIRSSILARKALGLIQKKGFQVFQIDSTVFLETPKLGSHKKRICLNLSKIFKLPLSQVSVKAKTAEGLGPEGASEAVSAQALVVLESKEVGS